MAVATAGSEDTTVTPVISDSFVFTLPSASDTNDLEVVDVTDHERTQRVAPERGHDGSPASTLTRISVDCTTPSPEVPLSVLARPGHASGWREPEVPVVEVAHVIRKCDGSDIIRH